MLSTLASVKIAMGYLLIASMKRHSKRLEIEIDRGKSSACLYSWKSETTTSPGKVWPLTI